MTIKEAHSIVADILDEETYEEYRHKLPDFYDHAQKQIATTVDRLEEIIDYTPEKSGEYDIEKIAAENGLKLYKVVRIITDGEFEHIFKKTYRFNAGSRYRILCYVYPETVTEKTSEDYEFEVCEEVLPAICYYAAAQCVATDNDQRPYYAFMDRYNNILQNIADARTGSVTIKIVKFGGDASGV